MNENTALIASAVAVLAAFFAWLAYRYVQRKRWEARRLAIQRHRARNVGRNSMERIHPFDAPNNAYHARPIAPRDDDLALPAITTLDDGITPFGQVVVAEQVAETLLADGDRSEQEPFAGGGGDFGGGGAKGEWSEPPARDEPTAQEDRSSRDDSPTPEPASVSDNTDYGSSGSDTASSASSE